VKLNEIQQKLKAPKNQYNDFGRYKYRSCEDILEAVKPLLEDSVLTISDEIVMIGNRFYVKAVVRFQEPGEGDFKTVTAYAREEENKKGMDGAQITGASSSYARKYALNGLFLIDDTKDADSTNNGSQPNQPPAQPAKPARPKNDNPWTSMPEKVKEMFRAQNATKGQIKSFCEQLNFDWDIIKQELEALYGTN